MGPPARIELATYSLQGDESQAEDRAAIITPFPTRTVEEAA